MVGVKEPRTSPMTLPIIRGSVDILAIVRATREKKRGKRIELND